MMSLIAALVLVSPPRDEAAISPERYIPDGRDLVGCTGQIVCPFTSSGRVCVCEGPVLSLGSWGKLAPEGEHVTLPSPPAFGAFSTERNSAKTEVQVLDVNF